MTFYEELVMQTQTNFFKNIMECMRPERRHIYHEEKDAAVLGTDQPPGAGAK